MATEQTYIMIKPDGVQRGLVADIIGRFEKVGDDIPWVFLAVLSSVVALVHTLLGFRSLAHFFFL
jgi:nucleoside diphosphate kinase